eukprot:8543659-Alexandrium_andersonii.AAC.1
MQTRFRRSERDVRGPRNGLKTGPRSSRGVRYASFRALSPMVATRSAAGGGDRTDRLFGEA